MSLLAKHEIEHIAFCCDDQADVCGRHFIEDFYIECDFDKKILIAIQKTMEKKTGFYEPTHRSCDRGGVLRRTWIFSFNEKG